MQNSKRPAGNYGETAAAGYLEGLGYEVIEKNYKRGRGEIDLICRDGAYIVFVEVKYRRQTNFGLPEEAVNRTKQRALVDAAQHYLGENDLTDTDCRFDVVAVFGREMLEVRHFINAFGAC